jgi:osmotically-inducible protein OsmY
LHYLEVRRFLGRQGLTPIAGQATPSKPLRSGISKREQESGTRKMKKIALMAALVGIFVLAGAVAARADVKDSWITTKAKIALLTMDGFSVDAANVDTHHGNVTIHGTVGTTEDRTRAEHAVREINGVKNVKNLLQVVRPNMKDIMASNDSDIKGRVEASLKTDTKMDDVKVASVNNGLVLLSGKAADLTQTLRAIENAYSVNGVHRVASDIQTIEN